MIEENMMQCSNFAPLPFYEAEFPIASPSTISNQRDSGTHFVILKSSHLSITMKKYGITEKRDFFKNFRILMRVFEYKCDDIKVENDFITGFSLSFKGEVIFRANRMRLGVLFNIPIDITDYFNIESTSNRIACSFFFRIPRTPKPFLIQSFLTRKLSVATLLYRIQSRPPHQKDVAYSILCNMFGTHNASMRIMEYKVSLLCPLTKLRLISAVKATTCSHVECVDAEALLNINDRVRAHWTCPVCGKFVDYRDLAEDSFINEVLLRVSPNCKMIVIIPDLTWREEKEDRNGDVIDLTGDDD